jgi:ribulose-bisphosphate carboxylase large chain
MVKKRVKEYKGYIDRNYKPTKDDLVCEFFVEPAKGISFESAAQRATSESSIGTWTDIGTMTPSLFKKIAPVIYSLNKETGIYKVAYPKELFEEHNVSQILSAVAGNLFGMSDVKNIKLLDINFPDSFMRTYSGPMYGIEGVRKLMKVNHRPFVGTIVKPKVGLNETQHAQVAYDSWIGGCDFVKDDENLTSQPFNKFDKRIKLTLRARDKAQRETGEKKMYFANVTAPYPEMVRRAKHVMRNGGEYVDQLHVGGIVGKMYEGKKEVKSVGEEIESQVVSESISRHRLQEDWHSLKPMLAVCSGGLSPVSVQPLIHEMGRDIVIQAGGGIHGHPDGTIAGAKAMRQAVDAEMNGISPKEYAKNHLELANAMKKWKKTNIYA